MYRYIEINDNFLLDQTDHTLKEFTEFKYYYSNNIINNLKNIYIPFDYTRCINYTAFLLEIYLTYSKNISVKPSLLVESILFYICHFLENNKDIDWVLM